MINRIERLQVKNFRNLLDNVIEFGPKINCIFGENGNGKTNILEAIYVLVHKKSFRKNTSFPQLLSIDGEKPEIIISSVFNQDSERYSLSSRMDSTKMEWSKNGKPIKRRPNLPLIFVNPADSYHFFNQAAFRRNWFDHHLSAISAEYKLVLNKYNSMLRNRNMLLARKPSHYKAQLDAMDSIYAEKIEELTKLRTEFLKELSPLCEKSFFEVFSEEHKLSVQLDSLFINKNSKQIEEEIKAQRVKDELRGHSTRGSHKDDYLLHFDGFNSYEYCSLGQQKMSYLSLLFATIELFRYKFKAFPIVLIDDVSGELDRERWQRLVHFLKKSEFQVLITTANENFKDELDSIQDAHKIFVSSGSVT
jgi:DNA replication and repair protein RecF